MNQNALQQSSKRFTMLTGQLLAGFVRISIAKMDDSFVLHISVQAWVWLLVLLLTGCASTQIRSVEGSSWKKEVYVSAHPAATLSLNEAPDCCASLRDLPFQDLVRGGELKISLGGTAPAHRFESGKSFFAAFKLVNLPRPFRIELRSYRSAEPGSLFQTLMPDARQAVLRPTALLLDESFRVVRRVDALNSQGDCSQNWAVPAYDLPLLVDESPQAVAYMVLLTTDESLNVRGDTVCGMKREGMSPVGELEIHTRTLPLHDPPLRSAHQVKWYPDAPDRTDVGLWQFMVAEPRLLVLGQDEIHILEPTKDSYLQRYAIPFSRVAWLSAHPQNETRTLAVAEMLPASDATSRNSLKYHLFEVERAGVGDDAPLSQMAHFLGTQVQAHRVVQHIGWRVQPGVPASYVEGGVASRVGQAALAGGMVTAFPCGLCQTGACPPEMLVTCGALFSVGAVLGGTGGLLREVFKPPNKLEDGRAAMVTLATGSELLSATSLERCVRSALDSPDSAVWQSQGLTAKNIPFSQQSSADSGSEPNIDPGIDYLADVSLLELTFTSSVDRKMPNPLETWALRMDGQVLLSSRGLVKPLVKRVRWESEAHPLSVWSLEGSPLLTNLVQEGCRQLANRLTEAAKQAWRRD